ncbi:MAG: VWA domain-containing protein, partial [Candidatus Adiutrix sp.]|nr:VWA domain-containing protein [Candidatus Adiutrix sp.]
SGELAALGSGWYEVGPDDKGKISGWVKADDVFEWKQTMCLAYTNPHDRSPVLMFENRKPLETFIKQPAEERKTGVEKLYEAIEAKNIPADFPVLSVEPKLAVDMTTQFYLLPILDFQAIEIDNRPGRLLELAAVTGSGEKAREKSDIRTNQGFLAAANVTPAEAIQKKGEDLVVDFVWVIDTTMSMGPYIDGVTALLRDASKIIAGNPEFDQRLRFGIWGFRDSVEDIPAIEYLTRNYTPELKPIEEFLLALEGVKETKVDSVDFPEDVFSGVDDALYKTAWRPNSLKIMVLVGDAPSHEMGHKWNYSGKNAEALRAELSEKKITFFSVQIRPNGAKRYQALAQDQFTTLASNKDVDKPAYIDVNAGQAEDFSRAAELIVLPSIKLISDTLAATRPPDAPAVAPDEAKPPISGEMAALLEDDIQESATNEKEQEFLAVVENSLKAAMVDWLGSAAEAQAPRDIVAWAVDKDLLDSNKSSLEVRLLINKRQLDGLRGLLSGVIEAGRRSAMSGDDFFTSLQSASSIVVRDPDKLSQAADIGKSGLIPEFLEGLPYKSRLMSMNNELWNSMSPDDQDNFINALEANIKAYQSLHDAPEGWIALNEGDDADETVYPLPLELLP